MEERGTSSRFVQGLRVSDHPVIDAVLKVIAGSVNKELVSAIIAAGESAVGLSGVDGHLTTAIQRDPDLGLVGKAANTDARLLDLLVNAGYLPVIACIAGDGKGNIYNVNADEMAVSCAVSWHADTLLFLTDVPGVKNGQGQIIGHLAPEQTGELIASGIASGGMQAKLEAAKSALCAGVEEVIIAPGLEPAVCVRLLAGQRVGTRLSWEIPGQEVST